MWGSRHLYFLKIPWVILIIKAVVNFSDKFKVPKREIKLS